jgi:hypothetical protein
MEENMLLHSLPPSHAEPLPFTLWYVLRDPLHFSDEFMVALVPPDSYAEEPLAPFHFENDQLKSSGCLDEHLTPDVHPLDV